jgi:hypothetical protein
MPAPSQPDLVVPAGQPGRVCRACQMPDPPDQTCTLGRDHYVGPDAGCPACGRLMAACARRPCTAWRSGDL